ncbi:hypothetical protein AMAG_18565 [Allomyces macrogynus ATCC 38327]|uniref:Uncharacterized protein n=1 Tax=Allomyces macrogynus (strain ATCC 38327) TaxID=578462 RepID=A0A0L0SDU9_ALLM3|nr:hypothetical protein AMAG_18565 [Allomyces macrogynus ATCC 38327]|eukprot:KNE60607.1 hypothetical protein AMAG_18565 [Allomyces macrogynus ATCC 38327]
MVKKTALSLAVVASLIAATSALPVADTPGYGVPVIVPTSTPAATATTPAATTPAATVAPSSSIPAATSTPISWFDVAILLVAREPLRE